MEEPSGHARSYIPAAVVSAAVIAAVVLFANVTSTARVTDNALELHHANATLGTAALARAAAGQAALFDDLDRRGLTSSESARVAEDELAETTSALRGLATDTNGSIPRELEGFLAALSEDPIDRQAVETAYEPVVDLLGERISSLESEIGRSDRLGDYVSGAIRLLVVLIIPAAAIFVYRRRASEQLRAARVRWEAQLQAEREISRAKDQFVAGMSHEIRTPLTGIYGFSEVLLDTPAGTPLERETVGVIHSEAAELSRMVDDFIVTSRIDSETLEVEPEAVDLTALAGSVAERFRRRGVVVEVDGTEAVAWCDQGRTIQVLTNLVSNAVRHGGTNVCVSVEPEASSIRCHVSDDGEGIPPELEDRLFTRFVHQGDEALITGSLGLGTWVARELARAMEGDVTLRTQEGLTVFTLTLPAAVAPETLVEVPVAAGSRA